MNQTNIFWLVMLVTIFFYLCSIHINLNAFLNKKFISEKHNLDNSKFFNKIAPKCSSKRMLFHEILWLIYKSPLIVNNFMSKMTIVIPLIGGFLMSYGLINKQNISFLQQMNLFIPGELKYFIFGIMGFFMIIVNFIAIIIIFFTNNNKK